MQKLNEFERKGWIKFEFDQHLEHWAKTANSEINLKLRNKEFFSFYKFSNKLSSTKLGKVTSSISFFFIALLI